MPADAFKNLVIKHFTHSSIADGGTFSNTWDADDNYILRFIFINFDGALGTKSTITIRINNVPLTKDNALCRSFGNTVENALPLEIDFRKDSKFEYQGVNHEGATKQIDVELVLERRGA